MSRLYGETISEDVVKQLNLRASILGEQGLRNSNHLRYLNQKTAWIRVISSVNRFEKEEAAFTNKSAKNFILSGGELKWDGSKFIPRTGFTPSIAEVRGRYNYDSNLGIRPEAGITSFAVTHKNTFGTLREANIGFNVWTRNDLNLVQDLYLRPGISLIIEWGNSIYLDDDGNVKDTISVPNYEEYFKVSTKEQIAQILKQNKENNFYNYDGFLGLVTNFNWSFRSDGGYDCSVRVITQGAVLESLSVIKSKAAVELELKERLQLDYFQGKDGFYYDNTLKGKVDPNTASTEESKYTRTFLHFFAQDIAKNFKPFDGKGNNAYNNPLSYDSFNRRVSSGEAKELEDFEYFRPPAYIKALKQELGTEDTGKEYDRNFLVTGFTATAEDAKEQSVFQYISLRTLLALLNISFSFKNPEGDSLVSFYTGDQRLTQAGTVESIFTDPKYKTFEDHFSLNPLYCIIPNVPNNEKVIKDGKSLLQITKGNVHDHIQFTKGPYDSIFNIFVNIHTIVQDLDSIFEGEKQPKEANVFDFVKKILGKINSYLGGINELDLHFDEDLQKWIVVDRELIVEEIQKNENNIELIDITGLKSTVSNVSLQTTITSELASQIAISAQGTKAYDSNANLPLFDWNANIQDRFFISNTPPPPPLLLTPNTDQVQQEEEEKKAREEFINNAIKAYQEINSSGIQRSGPVNMSYRKYNAEIFEKLKGDGIVRFRNAVYGKTFNNKKNTTDGLIPITLELTLDGIAGLKIGQVFRIGSVEQPSNILPDIYNKYGFIITGLDSKIENNKWFTTIKGITFKFEVDPNDPTGTEDIFIDDQADNLSRFF